MKDLDVIQSNFAGEEDSLSVLGGPLTIKNLKIDKNREIEQSLNHHSSKKVDKEQKRRVTS